MRDKLFCMQDAVGANEQFRVLAHHVIQESIFLYMHNHDQNVFVVSMDLKCGMVVAHRRRMRLSIANCRY